MYNYAACGVTGSDSRGYDTLREGEVRSHREFSKVLDLLQVDAYGVVLQSNVSMYTLPRASNNTCGSCELPKPGANEDEFAVTGMVDPEAVQRAVNAPGVVAVMTVPVPAKPETVAEFFMQTVKLQINLHTDAAGPKFNYFSFLQKFAGSLKFNSQN